MREFHIKSERSWCSSLRIGKTADLCSLDAFTALFKLLLLLLSLLFPLWGHRVHTVCFCILSVSWGLLSIQLLFYQCCKLLEHSSHFPVDFAAVNQLDLNSPAAVSLVSDSTCCNGSPASHGSIESGNGYWFLKIYHLRYFLSSKLI